MARWQSCTSKPMMLAPMRWTQSDSAVSQWFVEQMQEVHGIDISQQPPPPVSKIHDVRARRQVRNALSMQSAEREAVLPRPDRG